MAVKHPARFSAPVLSGLRRIVDDQCAEFRILDPFAGVGGVHQLAAHERGVFTYGVEIEEEWARQSVGTVCGDSRFLTDFFPFDHFDMVVTSPAYGNRMADQYLPPDTDLSKRYTYATSLGRRLSEANGAGLQWGDEYRDLHASVWVSCVDVLKPGGLVVLNVKDHFRNGVRQHVRDWHVGWFLEAGFDLVDEVELDSDGIKHSPNRDRCSERLITLRHRVDPKWWEPDWEDNGLGVDPAWRDH